MRTRFLPALFATLGALSGCVTLSDSAAPASGSGGASGAEVDSCKRSCDKMKFFDCNSAEEQARCYADCDRASSEQVKLFTGCAESSICDPACRTTVQPKDNKAEGGGGASASTCERACSKVVTCQLIPAGSEAACVRECTSKGYQYQIDCVNNAECSKITASCGGSGPSPSGPGDFGIPIEAGMPDFSESDCRSACDSISFWGCGSAGQHASCREHCATAKASARATFASCTQSSGGSDCDRKLDCLTTFLK